MKKAFCLSLIAFCLLAETIPRTSAEPTPPALAATPVNLAVPAGQSLALTLFAKGVQIYECRPVAHDPTRFEWVFRAPEADLYDAHGLKVGRHFAGPTWELESGGKVVGKVVAKADAPDGRGVPWLLLEAVESSGGGLLARVRSIQRLNTVGGQAPGAPPNASSVGQETRVAYTATYTFFVTQP
jgi:hypothetical protein